MNNLHKLSISEASELLNKKDLSPVDLVNAHLTRIKETESKLNSFITVLEDTAIKSAIQAEKEILSGNGEEIYMGSPSGSKICISRKTYPLQ